MSPEMIRRLVAKWPAAWREEFEERVSICVADGIPEYDALMTAFACVGLNFNKRGSSGGRDG